ncbi:MAG: sugar phosphate isomerase/epimerase [Clostridia bacterium]|nr:sugar phosphate isomerase/epimerase [Clostridia bacterium]
MKFSIWSGFYIELSPEDMVLEFEKNDCAYSELSGEHADVLLARGDPREVGREFKAFALAHGVSFPQGHLSLDARICREEDREYVKRQLQMFDALGTKRAVLHVDRFRDVGGLSAEEMKTRNVAALCDLLESIENTDLIICLENIRSSPSVAQSAEELLWFISELGSEHFGICLDTGHLNLVENKDQGAFIRAAGKRLKALHLADNDGIRNQHLMPNACGQVDFAEVIREAEKVGYDGIYNYEISGERNVPLEIRSIKTDYIRRITEFYAKQ